MEPAEIDSTFSPVEIPSDLSTVKMIIRGAVEALKSCPKSREIALAITKLDEARMWVEEAQSLGQ